MKMNRGIKWTAALVAVAAVMAFSTTAEARPHHGPPPPVRHHHHHHGGASFAGALVGTALAVGLMGAVASASEPERVVVQQQPVVYQPAPVVVQQQPVVYQPAPVVYQQTRPVVHYHYSSWW